MNRSFLTQRQSLTLDAKIRMSIERIKNWYEHWDGEVYVSFSGGKDSTVLADIVWSIYPDVPLVFSNTGLEYPEIVQFVNDVKANNPGKEVVIVRPERTFRDVILNEGYPIISKKVSRQLRILKTQKENPKWKNTVCLYDTGYKQDGTYSKKSRLPEKWRHLLNQDWSASELCCDILKKQPLNAYDKTSGRKRIMGIMASEGGLRAKREQCNIFDSRDPSSAPMLFWSDADVWQYIKSRNLPYSKIYDMGESRTGCMFCCFGAHLERGENRFERMKRSHPKQWDYCINKLEMRKVLKAIGIKYCDDDHQDLFDQ